MLRLPQTFKRWVNTYIVTNINQFLKIIVFFYSVPVLNILYISFVK